MVNIYIYIYPSYSPKCHQPLVRAHLMAMSISCLRRYTSNTKGWIFILH